METRFSSKPQVNLLTALLKAHEISEVVACPGSRNAILLHNFYAADFRLHPVTDERSAAFVAIGIWLKTRRPVVVCVTSGSALLNTLPAVAEAYYRHIPLIIISADRPAEWIGQLDGQTIPQVDALQPYARTWNLPELKAQDNTWYCERLINEALNAAQKYQRGGELVHINVPLSEPLFEYTTDKLPIVCPSFFRKELQNTLPQEVISLVNSATSPLLIIGQCEIQPEEFSFLHPWIEQGHLMVYAENISNLGNNLLAVFLEDHPQPFDCVIHIGGAMVNKKFKQFLRQLEHCPVVRIDEYENEAPDTFGHLRYKITADPIQSLQYLFSQISPKSCIPYRHLALGCKENPYDFYNCEALFLGNSSTVRWANRLFPHVRNTAIYCNRGTNGIEGSLSVAAGYSLKLAQEESRQVALCIIGDLSFFYDVNALWNRQLTHHLRILLINNGGGAIFQQIKGLNQSPVLEDYVMASHCTNARGIANSYDCHYLSEKIEDFSAEIKLIIDRLLHFDTKQLETKRPIIFEVFCQ